MKTAQAFLATLPTLLSLCFGCSGDAGDTGTPLGDPGGSIGTAGSSATAAGSGAGGTGVVGTAGSGVVGTAGSSVGVAGSGVGVAGSGGSGGGGAGGGTGGSSNGTSGGSAGAAGMGQAGAAGSGAMPTDGKGLYDLNCKSCHADQGIGSPLAPETQHPVRDYSTWVVRNGRATTTYAKPMDKFGTDKLSDAQLNLIWDYLDQPPQPTTGEALFKDYCANCHGADGAGGPVMRPLKGEGKNVLKLVRDGKSVGQYSMRHDSMPKFSTTRITDAELNLILAYVNAF
jgi:mono/diheme cytochrome c family protein